eukprot:7768751-Pyramimonas_sp.AAC.1
MIEIVESGTAFALCTYGLVYSSADRSYIVVPPDMELNPPPLWTRSQQCDVRWYPVRQRVQEDGCDISGTARSAHHLEQQSA